MKLYKRGSTIIIWNDYSQRMTYIYYTQREAIKRFKEKYGLRGKVTKVDYCPYLI